jgi:predicted lipoprotein with Yx(FWY)xxD motif
MIIMKNKIFFSFLLVVMLVLSACASATPTATMAPAATATMAPAATATMAPVATATTMAPATASAAAVVNVGQNASLGSFLVDSAGMTLYIFTNDSPNVSSCYSTCATYWPPLLTNGAPTAGTGVTASMLGTTTRTDGSVQVTYNGWPLYYYAQDKAAGDILGEGVKSTWYVMTPAGAQK